MKLNSCDGCGIVYDLDKLTFPDIYDHDSCDIIEENVVWDGEKYIAKLICPVCRCNIKEE